MVYVLSYLCLLAATLSALTPILLTSMFVCCAPIGQHQFNTSSDRSPSLHNRSSIYSVSRITQTLSVNLINLTSNTNQTNTQSNDAVVLKQTPSNHYVTLNNTNNNTIYNDVGGVGNTVINQTNNSEFVVELRAARQPRHVQTDLKSVGALNSDLTTRVSRSVRIRHHNGHHSVNVTSVVNVSAAGDSGATSTTTTATGGDDNIFVDDTGGRNERSTNLSHITGTSRKIQMYVTNRLLQILTDGTVNGTSDDSIYTILQRIPVKVGQLRIQGVATCQYLCIDACGILYGSRDFNNEDCVFNEMIETNHYNTYSSAKYSNKNRTMYLALNKMGQPRKVLLKTTPGQRYLGKMASYTRVLPRPLKPERMDELEAEMLRALRHQHDINGLPEINNATQHPLRHHGTHQMLCPPMMGGASETAHHHGGDSDATAGKNNKFRCRKRKKKKKKRRKPLSAHGGGNAHARAHDGGNGEDTSSSSVPKHRKQCSNKSPSSFISNPENPNQKSKEGIGSGANRSTTDSEINDNSNRSSISEQSGANRSALSSSLVSNSHVSTRNETHPANKRKGLRKHGGASTFTFNGVAHTDCDQYKNANKHRKCEEALLRQKHKPNFHAGEVDEMPNRNSRKRNAVHGTGIKSQNQNQNNRIACKYTTNMATKTVPSPTTHPVFGDALASLSSKHSFAATTVDDDPHDDWINEPVTDLADTDVDDGSDLYTATTESSTLHHSSASSNHHTQVPQLTPQAPPPFNDLDAYPSNEFEDASSFTND